MSHVDMFRFTKTSEACRSVGSEEEFECLLFCLSLYARKTYIMLRPRLYRILFDVIFHYWLYPRVTDMFLRIM